MDELWLTEGPREFDRWLHSGIVEPGAVSRIREGLETTREGRIDDVTTGQSPEVYFPGLTARPWWDHGAFPWIAGLEAQSDAITEELLAFGSRPRPSVSHPTGLADAGVWRALYLTSIGRPQDENRKAFPKTLQALEPTPGGTECGMTYFSTIEGGTHIKPHSGFTNAHLRCHLTLVSSGESRIRVSDTVRTWEKGTVLVFDDTFEHEVWNDGEGSRTVLLFDIWHPELSGPEIKALEFMMGVWRRMYARHYWASQLTSRSA
ncbi:MAG: aspartyl/asparaginyl beta-hydroxylase domain-containing protein [Gordonia polyisoprenivorans]|nr:aspartyl/asparaginyl beta-hydroxylase domain-containing protein [Gordonia polyisoprenivorans]